MDSSVASLLVTYGPLGVILVLLIVPLPGKGAPMLVPWYLVDRMDKEARLQREALEREQDAARRAVAELEIANRVIGELRQIAERRAGGGRAGKDP